MSQSSQIESFMHSFDAYGEHKMYRFPNNQGASVIKTIFSYGNSKNLWELAVIRFKDPESANWELDYTTPITDDVIGSLSDKEVDAVLQQIRELPKCNNL